MKQYNFIGVVNVFSIPKQNQKLKMNKKRVICAYITHIY